MFRKIVLLLDSTVGQKIIVGVTGVGLLGFVVAHLLGNFQIFAGETAINVYAEKLKELGALLWVARGGLLAFFVLHIVTTIRLAIRNRKAMGGGRPHRRVASTVSSRFMAISGVAILLFVIFHLAHFTLGYVQPAFSEYVDAEGRHDVYRMVVAGFQTYWIASLYILALVLVTSHLSHAIYSVAITLGILKTEKSSFFKNTARIIAILIGVGFISIPLSVLLGVLQLP